MLRIPGFSKPASSGLLIAALLLLALSTACWEFEASQELEIRDTYIAADDTPRWSDDGAVIVFSISNRIYRIGVHGDDLQRIPKKRHDGQFAPSLSPQGRIAYLNYNKRDPLLVHAITNHYLETMGFDGKGIKRLAKLDYATRPFWSPDGSQLAYSSGGNTPTIKVTAPDGSVQTELGPNPSVWIYHMKWHSNGRRIAVWNGSFGITTVDLDTNTWHVAAESRGPGGYVSPPAWSRSDERLYYIKRAPGTDKDHRPTMPFLLHSANYDGSDQRVIADFGQDFESITDLQLSANGLQLLFVDLARVRPRSYAESLYVVNTDGNSLKNLISEPPGTSASWSPDGSRIVVSVWDPMSRFTLYTMAPDGSDIEVLITEETQGTLTPRRGEPVRIDVQPIPQ